MMRIYKAADMIIDIGPGWFLRWRISCSRYFDEILKSTSLPNTNGDLEISVPKNVENLKISLK
jgi:hypothetical protein